MLDASNWYKDMILTLMQRGGNLDLFDGVNVNVHMLFYKTWASAFWAYPGCH